jgi:hypothetical protein
MFNEAIKTKETPSLQWLKYRHEISNKTCGTSKLDAI